MSKFTVIPLNYTTNMLEQYQKLSHLPGFVLLESSDKTHGRYDILSAYPYDQMQVHRDSAYTTQLFDDLQCRIGSTSSVVDLPFQGGAIGYFSYDLGALLHGIHSTPQSTLTSLPLMDIGLYDWALITDHQLKKVTLFAAHEQNETATLVEEVLSHWNRSLPTQTSPWSWSKSFVPLISKSDYHHAFHAIHHELKQGRCYQINYTQPFSAHYQGDPWLMYKQVRLSNPVPYSAFLRTGQADILSFSPERFFLMDKGALLASPIKGTERRATDPITDKILQQRLLLSEKNKAENVMIVDLLRNDFGKIAIPGSIQVSSLCELQSYPGVHHLVSHIQAQCSKNISELQAFNACFPGGSVTGAPKLEVMRVIAEHEPYARGVYCGCIGYFSRHGRFDNNIAIRTLIAKDEHLHLAVGGGIVIDSNCEEEYQECFTKMTGILQGLG